MILHHLITYYKTDFVLSQTFLFFDCHVSLASDFFFLSSDGIFKKNMKCTDRVQTYSSENWVWTTFMVAIFNSLLDFEKLIR